MTTSTDMLSTSNSSITESESPEACAACGATFLALATTFGGTTYRQSCCDECVAKSRGGKGAEEPAYVRRWESLTPVEYQEYDPKKVRPEARPLRALAGAWADDWNPTYRPRWLLLTGKPGLGKTTLAFQALKHAMRDGGSAVYVRGSQFDKWSSLQFRDDSEGTRLIAECHKARWLLFDDLGKGKLTERAEAELFDLVEHRNAHRLPLIITCQQPVKEIQWFSVDRGSAIAGRILDNTKQ